MARLRDILVQNASEYLSITSIHGLIYLHKSKNFFERSTWGLIIVSCILMSGVLIHKGLIEAEEDPIATTIEMISVKSIPFPAVTINSDGRLDPWGFSNKLFNTLAFFGQNNAKAESLSEKLRIDFNECLISVANDMIESLENMYSKKNVSTIKEELKHKYPSVNMIIKDLAPKLAAIEWKDDLMLYLFRSGIPDLIGNTLLTTPNFEMTNNLAKIEGMVNEALGLVYNITVTESDIEQCQDEVPECHDSLKRSYIWLYAPFYINRFPFLSLGFGEYISYFTRVFTGRHTREVFDRIDLNPEENLVLTKMTEMIWKMSRNQTLLSSFELVDLLTNAELERLNCHFDQEDMLQIKTCYLGNWTSETFAACCKSLSLFHHDLATVLKVIRYSAQTPSYYEDSREFESLFGDLSFLEYSNISSIPELRSNLMKTNKNSRVFICDFEGDETKTLIDPKQCKLFHRSFTSQGMGFTFNQADFWSLMKETKFTRTFAKILTPKGHSNKSKSNINQDHSSNLYEKSGITFPKRNGQNGELVLVLQSMRHIPTTLEYEINPQLENQKHSPFKLDLHDPLTIVNMDGSINIWPGTEATISIKPFKITTSNDLLTLNETKRNCRFHYENEKSELFKIYKQDSCVLECKIESIEQTCLCSPWQYPTLNNSLPICNGFDGCYQGVMRDVDLEDKCYSQCPIDCNMMRYSKIMTSKPLDYHAICSDKQRPGSIEDSLQNMLGNEHAYPPKFIRNYQWITYGKDIGEEKICEENLKNMAIVRLRIDDRLIESIVRTRRVRFTDHLSNIGKVTTYGI